MEKLVNDLTQKDEAKALAAAKEMIDTANLEAFKKLCQKSDFLFDFVKNNVKKRIKKTINKKNHKKLTAFFTIYNENYADALIESISQYASEELSDEMFELLETGTIDQKKYAAKYFYYIPDTIAQETLEKYAFDSDIELAVNSAQALGVMNDKQSFELALSKLDSHDEFEKIKAVRFLTSFGDKSAVKALLKTLNTASTAENIAGEIPYLMPILDIFETQNFHDALTCFDFILLGFGEILPLSEVFGYEIFEVLQYLIQKAQNNADSHLACVLLRALEKFTTLNSNDEYAFDESKDVKEELKAIYKLLTLQPKDFWEKQEALIADEFLQSKPRVTAALEIIRAMGIKNTKEKLVEYINKTTDEQTLVLAIGVIKGLGGISAINKSEAEQKIQDPTLKAVCESYFL